MFCPVHLSKAPPPAVAAVVAQADYRGDCYCCRLPVTTDHPRLRFDDGGYAHQLCHEAAKAKVQHPAVPGADEVSPPRTPSVPQGWGVTFDSAGSVYYYNIHTNEATWDLPDKSALPDASAARAVPPDAAMVGTNDAAAASRTLFHDDGMLRSPISGLFQKNLRVPRTLEDALHEGMPLFDPEAFLTWA